MSSRMDKYYKENEQPTHISRTTRNKNIYNKVEDEDYENLNLTNNISVIETDAKDLDIDTIKDLLNKKYQTKSTASHEHFDIYEEESLPLEEEEITKEYDLKKVLETAHQNKSVDYDHDRFKKLRETQYDILSSLNINRQEEPEQPEVLNDEEANLMNLIKTVNLNAEKNKALKKGSAADNLLEDLLGDEHTEVLRPMDVDLTIQPDKKLSLAEEIERTKQLSKKEIDDEIKKVENETTVQTNDEDDSDVSKSQELSNSFYTGKFQINDKDMDDFSDLEKEIGGGILVKILIVVVIIVVLAILVYFINKYLNLGLF